MDRTSIVMEAWNGARAACLSLSRRRGAVVDDVAQVAALATLQALDAGTTIAYPRAFGRLVALRALAKDGRNRLRTGLDLGALELDGAPFLA